MTSPYYNGFVTLQNHVSSDTPISYDACDECGDNGRSNNPVTGSTFNNEVVFQCQDCSLNEIYTELDKDKK
jgi:hypothetical protein